MVLQFNQATILNLSIPEPNSGCWLWLGNVSPNGYGRFKTEGINRKAHRASFILFNGPIDSDLVVRHKCHNKVCVNPEHLAVGTIKDNAKDQIDIPLSEKFKAGRRSIHHLDDTKKQEIREKYADKKRHTRGGVTFESLAIEYGVSIKVIWRIINDGYAY